MMTHCDTPLHNPHTHTPGAQIEAGDVKAASSTLSGGWVDELKRAGAGAFYKARRLGLGDGGWVPGGGLMRGRYLLQSGW